MEYKMTFEDGSVALMHYGVKGMKWGIWNEETRKRYLGLKDLLGEGGGGGVYLEGEDEANIEFILQHPELFGFLEPGMTPDEIMATVNPMFGVGEGTYTLAMFFKGLLGDYNGMDATMLSQAYMNCAACSLVYDLRRRGYDVDAAMTTNMAYIGQPGELDTFYKGATVNQISDNSLKTLNKQLSSEPDGARGVMWGTTVAGSGHAIAWEKENGQVVYRDCQSNTKYDSKTVSNLFSGELSAKTGNTISYARLDNATPKLNTMYQQGIISKSGKDSKADIANSLARETAGYQMQQYRQARRNYADTNKRIDPVSATTTIVNNVVAVEKNKNELAERVVRGK